MAEMETGIRGDLEWGTIPALAQDPTFEKVVELWGKRGAMDMVAVMNTYAVSGYFAIAVDERAAEGKPELPAVK